MQTRAPRICTRAGQRPPSDSGMSSQPAVPRYRTDPRGPRLIQEWPKVPSAQSASAPLPSTPLFFLPPHTHPFSAELHPESSPGPTAGTESTGRRAYTL